MATQRSGHEREPALAAATEQEQFDGRTRGGRADIGPWNRSVPEEEIDRLRLDNEDLRFECGRLKTSIAQAQAELLRLSERNGVLQRRLELVRRFVPSWGVRLARVALRHLRRG